MLHIKLTNDFINWKMKKTINCEVYFAGYFHINFKLFTEENALNYLLKKISNIKNNYNYEQLFKNLNGSWACIIYSKKEVILASDIIRSIPIFYSVFNNTIYVSNTTHILRDKLKLNNINQKNIDFYKKNYSGPQGETILKGLYDVNAGHFVRFNKNELMIYKYWFMPAKLNIINPDHLLTKTNEIFDIVFRRMKIYFDANSNKKILLPLSGGMDSRLLAWALDKYQIKNEIIAYSFGINSEHEEALISKKIALKLDFKWLFIKYTKAKWLKFKDDLSDLVNVFPSHKSSLHLMDFIAIQELSKMYPNSIVLPGHTLDNLTGLSIPPELKFKNFIDEKNLANLNKLYDSKLTNYEEHYKNNKLSSFVVNSIRTYEYFGLECYLPYWDLDLTDFWYSVPTHWRIERNLFRLYLNTFAYKGNYAYLAEIPLALNRKIDSSFINITFNLKIKTITKYFLKKFKIIDIMNILLYRRKKKKNFRMDYIGFYYLFEENDLKCNPYSKHYLNLIAILILLEIQKKYAV